MHALYILAGIFLATGPYPQSILNNVTVLSELLQCRDNGSMLRASWPGGLRAVPQFCPDILLRLFAEDRTALLRYVRRFLPSREDSEDIVQEAFLRTCEHATEIVEPRAFAFTVARNLATDSRRHTRLAKTDTLGDLSQSPVVASGHSLEGEVLADEEGRLLREAVEQLSPQCRAVFQLRVFQGCSYKEIAERLSLAPKTVENHIGRAIRETHEYLRRRYQLTKTDHGRRSSTADS